MQLNKIDIVGDSLNECAYKLIHQIYNNGTTINSRNGECKSLYNVDVWLKNPRNRVLNLAGRKNSLNAVFAELFWILSGSNRIDPFINYFLKRAKNYSDDGGLTWRGGYGKRLWNHSQFQSVLAHFKEDKYTRRAIQTIYDASMDNYLTYKDQHPKMLDVPCNNWIQYYIVPADGTCSNDRFCMKVVQRSGDAIWGVTNVNMFVFSVIHEIMYEFVKRMYPNVVLGGYCHSITNAHIYLNGIIEDQVKDILSKNYLGQMNDGYYGDIQLDEISIYSPLQLKHFMKRLVEMFEYGISIESYHMFDKVKECFHKYHFSHNNPLRAYALQIAEKIEMAGVKEPMFDIEEQNLAIKSNFFSEKQFKHLLETQHQLNEKFVNGYLKNVSIEQYSYALVNEISEFLESTPRFKNHKFWKPYMEDDIQNSKIEIIDILHFGLSIMLVTNRGILEDYQISEIVEHQFESYEDTRSFFNIYTRMLIGSHNSSVFEFAFNFKEFLNILLEYHKMTFDELYDGYFKKVQLNEKRIEEGYMRGEYEKVKDGVEDNRNIEL